MLPNAASRITVSKPSSSFQNHYPSPQHPVIQIPMLGPNLQVQPNKLLQGQQSGPQQQQGPQQSEIPLPPQSGQDFTLSSVLHFLQTEWRRYERDRNEWEIERAEMRVRRVYCVPLHFPNLSHAFHLRLVLLSLRANAVRSTMSSSTLCAGSKCWSMLCE